MSLLIKALANAEKDKQAELNKKQAGEHVAHADLPLELAPIDDKSTSESQLTVEETPLEKSETKSEFELTTDAFADNGLLLEESGLNAPLLAVAKPKQGAGKTIAADKITAQSSLSKGNLQEARHAAKPANKVAAPVATATQSQSQVPKVAETNQTVAAKAFVANQQVKTPSSKSALVLLGVAGALMIWLGLQGYSYLRGLTAPTIVVVKPVMPMQPQVAEAIPAAPPAGLAATSQEPQVASSGGNEVAVSGNQDINTNNQTATPNNKAVKQANVDEAASLNEASSNDGLGANVNTIVAENEAPKKSRGKNLKNTGNESVADSEASLQNTPTHSPVQSHSPVQLVSKTPSAGVDPTLLAAYQAFNRGEDASAQQQYRQVLQRDVRNVDALLGMAAIAQRQGRDADAAGWYQKVLEIEPRNTIAQSAIVSPQANTDAVSTESRIKSMLAQQPESANLYAALGNLYAEQNQWPAAQGAYFDASRFAPNNADYAFNLAISLDQLGKSSLALKQYQRALDLLNKSGATSPDRAQLEARIQALQ